MESSTGAQAPNQHRTDIIGHISGQPAPYVRAGRISIDLDTEKNLMHIELLNWVFQWPDGTVIECGRNGGWYEYTQENASENIPYIAGYSPNELLSIAQADARLSQQTTSWIPSPDEFPSVAADGVWHDPWEGALAYKRNAAELLKTALDEYDEADLGCNFQKIDAHDHSPNAGHPCTEMYLVGLTDPQSVLVTAKLDDGPTSSAVQKPKPRFGWHG